MSCGSAYRIPSKKVGIRRTEKVGIASLMVFFCYMFSVVLFDTSDVMTCCVCRVHSPKIMIVIFLKRDDSLTSRSVIMRTEQLTKTHVFRTTTVAEGEVGP